MNKDKNFYPKMQEKGTQLKLGLFANSVDTVISQNVKEAEFIDAFKHLVPVVIKTIHSAHENVLVQWRTFPPYSNKTKADNLNDRIQMFAKKNIPYEYIQIDDYNIVTVKVGSFLCIFKNLSKKNLPKFSLTKRALEKFSQYKRKDNNFDVPYVVIGYKCTWDYQQITEINAVKSYIDAENSKLCVDWFVSFDEMLNKKILSSGKNIFIEEIQGELPILKKKSS